MLRLDARALITLNHLNPKPWGKKEEVTFLAEACSRAKSLTIPNPCGLMLARCSVDLYIIVYYGILLYLYDSIF